MLRCQCQYCLSAVMDAYPHIPIVVVETAYPSSPYDNDRNVTDRDSDFAFSEEGSGNVRVMWDVGCVDEDGG